MVRFNFSGVVEERIMQGISKKLLQATKTVPADLPTALAVNSRFIGIGTQRGKILLFDHFEVLRQKMEAAKDEAAVTTLRNNQTVGAIGSVTTLDLSLVQGEMLVAGYTSGLVCLWDTIKGVVLKSVIEAHATPSPVTSVRFLNEVKVVTVDAGGLVNKLNFAKSVLWQSYSVETECLLDGTAGQILAMNVLEPVPSSNSSSTVSKKFTSTALRRRIQLIALSSERSSFTVAVEPTVHVLHRWAKPEAELILGKDDDNNEDDADDNNTEKKKKKSGDDDRVYLPCLAWAWGLVSGGGHVRTPILARAWGCCLQLLMASFPEDGEDASMTVSPQKEEILQWPAFGVEDEFQVDAPVVAMNWLNERSLVYLTVTNEFTVVDTVMMTLLERLDFSGYPLVYAEFSLSRKQKPPQPPSEETDSTAAAATAGTKLFCTTFQNSQRSCDDRLLLLCEQEVKSTSVIGAKRRISDLEQHGEWLESLALALDHYETTITSQQDRKRTRDKLSQHPEYYKAKRNQSLSEEEAWISKLLIRYLNIAVENAPEVNEDTNPEWVQSQLELAHSHFQMLAGVCVEFCVVTKRLDLLFGSIFRSFHSVGYLNVFLDVLEPYILNDKLDYIAPEAMAHFVEHCRATNGIATVERCLLHLDVTIMDFDSILALLRANEMYSALFYIFNQGLEDYTTPLEILMERIFDAADTGTMPTERRPDGVPQNDFERYGYKAILYLQSCFRNKTFPHDSENPKEDLFPIIRQQLLRFLLQESFSPSSSVKKPSHVVGQRALRYPYSHILLMVDPKAVFDSVSIAMNSPSFSDDPPISSDGNFEPINGWEAGVDQAEADPSKPKAVDCQEIISMFMSIIIPDEDDIATTRQTTLYQSEVAVNTFLDFLAEYLMKGVVRANQSVTFMILKRMASKYESTTDPQERLQAQTQILQLITALPRASYEPEKVLKLVQNAGIHRAALLLHQEGAWVHDANRTKHFKAAIDCYLDDEESAFRKEVFAYVKKECSGAADEGTNGDKEDDDRRNRDKPSTMRDALALKLPDLVRLDPSLTAEVVAELFVEDLDLVIETFKDDEAAQFMFLQAVISGKLNEMDQVAGAVLNTHLTMEHHHKYLALMTKLHPDLVYDYLSSHDNYRPEACLRLCQQYDIADASAYLLERMGNVSSALQLLLQTLESHMMGLKRTIRGMSTDFFNKYNSSRTPSQRWKNKRILPSLESHPKQVKEIEGVKRILVVALDLCERNSGSTFTSRTEYGSQLWFNVLDRLINAKGFLRLSKEQPGHAKVMAGVLSELLRLTMQRMVSSVPLPDLVRKVTSDHAGSPLGELREMIESLLSTYGMELHVFSGAVGIFHHDSQQMQKKHLALRVQGAGVREVTNIPLAFDAQKKNSAQIVTLEGIGNSGDILKLVENGNAAVVADESNTRTSKSRAVEQGLGNALARLRSRRNAAASSVNHRGSALERCQGGGAGAAATGLNFMTSNELSYRSGELSADATYFEDRQIGALGNAEHRGRLMKFSMY